MLASTDATHVVVQIDWGAKCFVSVTDHNHKNDEKTKIVGKISAKIETLELVGLAGAEFQKVEKDSWNELSLKIFGDVSLDNVPTNADSAVDLIRSMPQRVQKCNGGKGKPVTLHMLPLLANTEPVNEVDDTDALEVDRLFSRIDELKQRANDLNFKVRSCGKIVKKNHRYRRRTAMLH